MTLCFPLLVNVILALVCFSLPTQAQHTKANLEGQWRVLSDKWEPLIVTFGPSNLIKIESDNGVAEGTYKVNFAEKPAHLDIEWKSGEQAKTIIEFIEEDRIRIENLETYPERPKGFSEQAIMLERIKRKVGG